MSPTSPILLWDLNRVGREHYSRIITYPSTMSVTNYCFKLSNRSALSYWNDHFVQMLN